MAASRLRPSTRIEEADWLRARLRGFGSSIAAVVPDGFPAYARILHPVQGADGESLRWADVATRSGRAMHPLVQFHAIAQPLTPGMSPPGPWNGIEPMTGDLLPERLLALTESLAKHTRTASSCWFCLWDGYGWLRGAPAVDWVSHSSISGGGISGGGSSGSDTGVSGSGESAPVEIDVPPEVMQGPRVSLPGRDYFIFEGPLNAAAELGGVSGWIDHQSPNLFWPQDHAWCVASEIDLYCTLVAGSVALIEALQADPRLETWKVEPGDPISYDSDLVNT